MNYFDQNEEEQFRDQPEEIEGQYNSNGEWIAGEAPPAQITIQRPAPQPVQAQNSPVEEDEEDQEQDEISEEEDRSEVLNDARLRLEQGRLFEMVMKHDLFDGVEADPRAIKSVQKLIREYAQERMEIMLGMRQEPSKEVAPTAFPMELFPFNSLEVETLKSLAAAATKGASRDAEPLELSPMPTPTRTTLNPIGANKKTSHKPVHKAKPTKPLQPRAPAPIKRSNATVEQILREEGLTLEQINEVMNGGLTKEEMGKMTAEQLLQRNASIRNRKAIATNTTPMPTVDQQIASYSQRSQSAEAQTKGWRELMDMVKVMPTTKVLNKGQQ